MRDIHVQRSTDIFTIHCTPITPSAHWHHCTWQTHLPTTFHTTSMEDLTFTHCTTYSMLLPDFSSVLPTAQLFPTVPTKLYDVHFSRKRRRNHPTTELLLPPNSRAIDGFLLSKISQYGQRAILTSDYNIFLPSIANPPHSMHRYSTNAKLISPSQYLVPILHMPT